MFVPHVYKWYKVGWLHFKDRSIHLKKKEKKWVKKAYWLTLYTLVQEIYGSNHVQAGIPLGDALNP